jgi:predicted MFS family arabinose efflux permease
MGMTSRDIRLLGLVAFASMASMRMCDPMLMQWSMDFGVSQGQASHVIAAFSIAYGVMQLVYGPLGQRLGSLRLITWAAGISAVLSILTALSSGLDALLLARSAMGGVAAAIIPLSMAWIGDKVAYDSRQQTLARLMSATVTGLMAGQWFGGFAAQYLGWRWAFAFLALLFATGFVLLFRSHMYRSQSAVAQPSKGSAADYMRGTLDLLLLAAVQRVLFLTFSEGALAFGVLVFVPSMLIKDFALSSSAAGAAMLLYGVGGLMYSQFAKRWIAWLGEAGLALTGGICIACGLVLLLLVSPSIYGALLACLIIGLGFYMLHNVLQTQATQMAPHNRSTAVTLFASVLFLGQSTGVVVLSLCLDNGVLHQAFVAVATGIAMIGFAVSRQSLASTQAIK